MTEYKEGVVSLASKIYIGSLREKDFEKMNAADANTTAIERAIDQLFLQKPSVL